MAEDLLHDSVTLHHDKVLIVDFGSQVTQLIARRVREERMLDDLATPRKPRANLCKAIG